MTTSVTDKGAASGREPVISTWIQNLITGGIPAELHHQFASACDGHLQDDSRPSGKQDRASSILAKRLIRYVVRPAFFPNGHVDFIPGLLRRAVRVLLQSVFAFKLHHDDVLVAFI